MADSSQYTLCVCVCGYVVAQSLQKLGATLKF